MDYTKLKNNIIDVIKEEQIKLGYRSETIRLYYPLASLNRFLSSDCTIVQMQKVLKSFCDFVKEELGEIEVANRDERFCFAIPPKGVDYIHTHMGDTAFLSEFIKTIEKHGCTIEDISAVFYKYSAHVHVEHTTHGEFDYLIYFEDGKPDSFRYCLTKEGCHMIYHRFTIEDYEDFAFSPV